MRRFFTVLPILCLVVGVNASASNNALLELHQRLQALGKEIDELRGENETLKHQLKTVKSQQKKGFIAVDGRIDELSKKQTVPAKIHTNATPTKSPAKKPVVLTPQQRAAIAKKKAQAAQLRAKQAAIAKKRAELSKLEQEKLLAIKKQKQLAAAKQAAIARKKAELAALTKAKQNGADKKAAPVVQKKPAQQPPNKKNTQSKKTASKAVPAHIRERQAYHKAYGLLKGSKYAGIKAFKSFIEKYPKSRHSENAHYWLGEAYYGTKNYKEAVKQFVVVLNKFKSGSKASDAALKLGYSFYHLRDWELARRTFEDVVKFFPKTKAAGLADKRLRKMAQAGH